jgi:hypothetical protein
MFWGQLLSAGRLTAPDALVTRSLDVERPPAFFSDAEENPRP